jgi:signal transduction histidine kinase
MQLQVNHNHPAFTALYDEMEKHAGIGTWIYHQVSGISSFSRNFCRMAGMSREHPFIRFEDLIVQVHPEDRYLLTQTTESLLVGDPVPECEYRILSGARTRFVRQYGKKMQDMDDTQQTFGFWQDITRWRMKDNSFHFLESLIDANIDGVIVLDMQYKVQLWNRQTEVYTGIKREQAIANRINDVLESINQSPNILSALSNAMNGISSFIDAGKNFLNGLYESHYVPIQSVGGHVTAVLILLHDVADRVKAEDELKQRNRELRLKNAELQAFSYITSHDFKDPIARIYTAIELLLSRGGQSKFDDKKYLRQVQAPLQRIRLLADDITQFYRLDNTQSSFKEIDLNQVLALVLKRLENQVQSTKAVIDTAVLPSYQGHFSMLAKLFQHIIGSAVASGKPDTTPVILIRTEVVNGDSLSHENILPDASYLAVRFSDNGRETGQVFGGDEFMLCEKIAELHGGFIADESTTGSGTTVCCYLQLALS